MPARLPTSPTECGVVNIAAYRFVRLHDLPAWRERLRTLCERLSLKGTILLSPEGINLFLAGGRDDVVQFLDQLRAHEAFADIEVKESFSQTQPFRRLLVKIKREIISLGLTGIDPRTHTSPKLPPRVLQSWLDEGREVTLLDVRNNFEVEYGTFESARAVGIDSFRQLPEAVAQLPEAWRERPVVMFCTGGIRCEKAGPYLEQQGFREVYQLDGGILRYFEECGSAHFRGDCFVFDDRIAVDSQLRPTVEGPEVV